MAVTSLAVDFRESAPLIVRADVDFRNAAGQALEERRIELTFLEPADVTIRAAIGRRESWEPDDYDTSLLRQDLTSDKTLWDEWFATGTCPDCGVYRVEDSREVRQHDFTRDVNEYLVAGDDWSLMVIATRFEWRLVNNGHTGESNDRN